MSGRVCECGNKAEFLCDATVPLTREEGLRRFRAGERVNAPATCDAPLCARCRVQVGTTFACSRSGRGRGCPTDSVDRCAQHAPAPSLRVT